MADDQKPGDSDDLSRFHPPQNLHDAAAWDKYWQIQVAEQVLGFHDWFIGDGPLARVMVRLGLRTVLCAGNGASLEPQALSYAGFKVTAADLSAWATEFNRRRRPTSAALRSFFYAPVFFRPIFRPSVRETCSRLGWLVRNAAKRLTPVRRSGGSVEFQSGNLLDPEFCKGPFDVIIERRTAQLFSEGERNEMLEKLAARLNPTGIFVSHCHLGWWKPGGRRHVLEPWFRQHGFIVSWEGADVDRGTQNTAPVALLSLTTG